MLGSAPLVSVVTSVYNEMPWLPVAIESVLSQTFTDFEFLLVDDGSKNGCPEALDDYEQRDARIRVIRKENGGQVWGLNRGLAEARGAYVARLDADDLMYPTRLAKQVTYLDTHPDVALVGSQVDLAAPTGTTRWDTPTEPHVARWTLLVQNCFMGGGVMFRTDVVRALGGYEPTAEYTEDYDLWMRIAESHEVVNLPEVLSWFNNLRTNNGSTLHAQRQERVAQRVMADGMRRYVPDALPETLDDLIGLLRYEGLRPARPGRVEARISAAAALLSALHRAFLRRHQPPRAAAAAIRRDVQKRFVLLRWALIQKGGVAALGRLHRPGVPGTEWALRLPALLVTS